ncbi:MAG: PAS domain S-box protein [Methylotenera sp.]
MSGMPSDGRKKLYEHHNLRHATEVQLAKNPAAESPAAAPIEKLLNEPQVHQIDLKMQNAELCRAKLALEQSHDRYRDLFDFAPIGYLTLTAAGIITAVNFTGATLLGVERKKLLLHPFSQYIGLECVDRFHLYLSCLSQKGEQQSCDMHIKREDGELRYVHMDAAPAKADDGTITLRITLTDITENKRVENALRESTGYLDSLIDYANGPIVVWNASHQITKVNRMVEKVTGLKSHEVMGRSIDMLFPAADREAVMAKIQLIMNGEDWESLEIPMQHTSGAFRVISWNSATLYQPGGNTVRAIVAQGQDITERKRIEQDLRIAATAFEVQESILVTDEYRIIIRVNKAFTRMMGYSAEEALGQPVSMLRSGLHDAAFYRDMWYAIDRDQYWQGEIWDRRKNGEVFPGLVTMTAVPSADGHTTHYVCSLLDITLQKQAEKVLLDTRKHLEGQVKKTVAELTHIKEEADELNTALKVMIKLRESESSDAKNLLILELKQEVMPFLQRLKNGSRDSKHIHLISTLDANLQRLISSYGCATSITSAYKNLTPKEIQVASMVREGLSTKVIAATLSLSPETISIHRKNIRKKLGLDSKSDNLRSYLITLDK